MAKKKTVRKGPPPALIDDIKAAFDKHNWSGTLMFRPAAITDNAGCPPGTTPHEISYQLPNGTWVTKTVCI